ncbi:FecR domain-containing protein [Paraburkholderia caballeronis]|uniref:FecR family protein n=1 Tax=Paraburkholderia caballeronis TaxID=416943 RepID=A0A1H7U9R2_9BURK|nr:FecR domain-containing protein [Paraburkholderia caballeronis]PXW23318.1 FecR family protein [Paraburkholderia caballeronis]PXW98311.1 FecR family protein [Paraburkholderia caballeronis]RAJ95041.1 FecR family protein [Paraburkholderia caballeronis]SEC60182.1 FecR family protein [Paraburkholderia caballeronis]SEL93681.1 FecR family protein [Paraburkholderia caballeronis]
MADRAYPQTRRARTRRLADDVVAEAADWLVRMQSGELTADERAELERWRNRSPAHADAWSRATQVLATFSRVPSPFSGDALRQLRGRRRQVLRGLGALLIGAPSAWLAWRAMPWSEWTADCRTAAGERKRIELADGTQLVLNTATAVDVAFSAGERRLRLVAGEILVTTGHDPSAARYRPFVVQTAQGIAQALGTRFTVRVDGEATRVAVFDGTVAIRPARSSDRQLLRAGDEADFRETDVSAVRAADPSASSWEQGMFVARHVRLADLIGELARYRSGVLRCDPAVADLRVSGAFPVDDTDASLVLLTRTLPVRLASLTPYWITVEPR